MIWKIFSWHNKFSIHFPSLSTTNTTTEKLWMEKRKTSFFCVSMLLLIKIILRIHEKRKTLLGFFSCFFFFHKKNIPSSYFPPNNSINISNSSSQQSVNESWKISKEWWKNFVSISKEPVIYFLKLKKTSSLSSCIHSRLLREKSDYGKEIVNVKLSFETTTTIRP